MSYISIQGNCKKFFLSKIGIHRKITYIKPTYFQENTFTDITLRHQILQSQNPSDAYLALAVARHRRRTPRIIAWFARITRIAIYNYAA